MINPLIIKDKDCDNPAQSALDISLLGKTCNENNGNGGRGKDGLSAYEIAVIAGFSGNYIQWLASLVGAPGISAYQVAVTEGGFVGTVGEWLLSLVGTPGKSAYELAVEFGGYEGTLEEWLDYLANNYELPIASPTVLGGIMIGDGLSIDANGVVSVDISLQASTDAGNRTTNDIILDKSKITFLADTARKIISLNGGWAQGLDRDSEGNIYLLNRANNTLQRVTADLTLVTTIIGGNAEGWFNANNVAIDREDNIYIADYSNNRILKYPKGQYTGGIVVAGVGGKGSSLNQLDTARGIAFDLQNRLHVYDSVNRRILRYETGSTVGIVVAGGNGSGAGLNQLNAGNGIAFDKNGILYIADTFNYRVLKVDLSVGPVGIVVAGGNGNGSALNQFGTVYDIDLDNDLNLYVADSTNNRIMKFIPGNLTGEVISGGNGQGNNDNQYNILYGFKISTNGYYSFASDFFGGRLVVDYYGPQQVDLEARAGELYRNDKRLLTEDDLFGQQDIDFTETNNAIEQIDQGALHKTGNEIVELGAVKDFKSSPLVPDPTLNEQAMNLKKGRALPLDGVFSRNIGIIARDQVVNVSASYSKNFLQITPSNNYTHVKLFCTDGNSYVRAYEIQAGYDSNRFQSWQQLTPYQAYTDRGADFHIDIKAIDGFGPVNFGLLFRIRGVIATSMMYRIEYHHMYPAVGTDYLDWTKLNEAQYLTSTQPISGVYPFQNEKASVSQLNTAVTFLQNQLNILLPMTGEMSPEFIRDLALIDDGDTSGLVNNAPYKTSTGFIKYAVPGGIPSTVSSEFSSELQ